MSPKKSGKMLRISGDGKTKVYDGVVSPCLDAQPCQFRCTTLKNQGAKA